MTEPVTQSFRDERGRFNPEPAKRTLKMKRILSITVSLLVVILIVYLFSGQSVSETEFVRSLDTNPETFERTFVEYGSMDVVDFTESSGVEIYSPSTFRLVDEYIFIADFSDFGIFQFSKEGNFIRKISTGQGQGPGEFQNLTDFDVCGEIIWAVDAISMRLSTFSISTGEFLTSVSPEKRPARVACLEDGFIVQWLGSDYLFSKFDFNGNELHQFGQIIENQLQHMFTLDGIIVSNGLDRFVYIPFYASLIYHFHGDGTLINVLKAPDGLEFPVTQRDGALIMAPDTEFKMRAGSFIDDILYIHTFQGVRDDQREWEYPPHNYLDKYDLQSGLYQGSIEFPFHYYGRGGYDSGSDTIYFTSFDGMVLYRFDDEFDF